MLIRYILAVLIGIFLAGIINMEFKKNDTSPIRRTASITINIIAMICICLILAFHAGLTYRFIVYSMLSANLLYISNCDIREQAVSYETIAVFIMCSLAVLIFNKDNVWWNYILSGIGFSALFILISRLTRSAIGIGDALIIGAIGLCLGFYHTFAVVIFALLLGGIISIILFLLKKVTRQTTLPFAPFLTAGFLVSILI